MLVDYFVCVCIWVCCCVYLGVSVRKRISDLSNENGGGLGLSRVKVGEVRARSDNCEFDAVIGYGWVKVRGGDSLWVH